jgi:hypothetical protein
MLLCPAVNFSKRLKAALVNISTRHQDELEEQASESLWLKNSLIECSTALTNAVSLLSGKDSVDVPQEFKELAERAAKFNYENVASACKCAICPPLLKVSGSVKSTSSSSGDVNDLTSKVGGVNLDSSDHNTDSMNGTDETVMPRLPAPKMSDAPVSVFKNLTRDVSGLYVVAPPAGLQALLQQSQAKGSNAASSLQR